MDTDKFIRDGVMKYLDLKEYHLKELYLIHPVRFRSISTGNTTSLS